MNVLFLAHSFPRGDGDAAGSFLLRLARALAAEDVRVQVVAPGGPGLPATDTLDGITVDRFRYAPRRYETLAYTGTMAQDVAGSWSARLALVGFLGSDFASAVAARRRFQPDVVHAHWWFPAGLVGTWLHGLAHVPLVTTLHGTDVRLAKAKSLARPLFRHVMRHSAAVTTVSRWLAEEVRTMMPSIQPTIAPMPAATELFSPNGEHDPHRLLFVGRLNAQKGVEHLLRAVAAMRSTAHLDIVGDGPARAELEMLAGELGVASRVRWLGVLKQPELVEHYRRAAALVVPSTDEGFGLVAVEALLCETPVVAFDSGGLRDVVTAGSNGWLVPVADSAALANALDEAIEQPDRARMLGQAGRLQALAAFAPESAARRYADVYRQVRGARTS